MFNLPSDLARLWDSRWWYFCPFSPNLPSVIQLDRPRKTRFLVSRSLHDTSSKFRVGVCAKIAFRPLRIETNEIWSRTVSARDVPDAPDKVHFVRRTWEMWYDLANDFTWNTFVSLNLSHRFTPYRLSVCVYTLEQTQPTLATYKNRNEVTYINTQILEYKNARVVVLGCIVTRDVLKSVSPYRAKSQLAIFFIKIKITESGASVVYFWGSRSFSTNIYVSAIKYRSLVHNIIRFIMQ